MTRDAAGRAVQMPLAPPAGSQEAVPASGRWSLVWGLLPCGPARPLRSLGNPAGWSTPGRAAPQDHTHTSPHPGLRSRAPHREAAAAAPRPWVSPLAARGSLPALVGHCWTDTGGKKQEKACLGAMQPLPARRQPAGPPCSALSPALRAPTRTWGARAPS